MAAAPMGPLTLAQMALAAFGGTLPSSALAATHASTRG